MWAPKYTITNKLLRNLTRITEIKVELSGKKLPRLVFMEMWRAAQELSTHASTSIEGNPLGLTMVKSVIKGQPKNAHASELEVLNYNKILVKLDEELKEKKIEVDLKLLLRIQKQVTVGLLPKHDCGSLRKRAVVVNDPVKKAVAFIPPDYSDVPKLADELLKFVENNRGELDPIILAGIFHKQLVLIHPFMDGNGRTTRLATKVLLADLGLDTFNLFSFENYYNRNVSEYFRIVGERGDYYELAMSLDFTNWLEYFTDGLIDELLRVQKLMNKLTEHKILESYQQAILDYLSVHGKIRDRDYARLTQRADSTRILDFKYLVELGLIERRGAGPSTYYVMCEK